jgi:cytochrome c2
MKKEPGMAYNTKTLNRIFAVLSVVFLFVVIWMVMDDYIRPWKKVQLDGLQIKREATLAKLSELEAQIKPEEVKALEEKIDASKAVVETKKQDIKKLEEKLSDVQKKIYAQNMYVGSVGSNKGAYQFNYEHAVKFNQTSAAIKYKVELDKYKQLETDAKDARKSLEQEERNIKLEIAKFTADVDQAEKDLKSLLGAKNRTLIALKKTDKDPIWLMRNAPFIDYLDPTIKIHQVVIDNALDDRYFQHVPKVDRCTTCHVFADQAGFENQPNPFKTHPNLDTLAVGVSSAHPMKDFGCTSCHSGEGQRVNDFNSPAHIPDSEEKKQAWIKKYNWHEPHKLPSMMLPLKYTEASCVKCHTGVERVPTAAKLNDGRELIEQYGCYGCHKIEGWDHLKKPGPMLTSIKGKVKNVEFLKNWIWSPHSFNPLSKMPAFFNQVNNSKPEFQKLNITEVNAMAEYIWNKSADYKALDKFTGGDSAKGKELIEKIGCVSCHQVEGIDDKYNNQVASRKGPYLTGTGSKVDADWLVTWLKKPNHYSKETIMPSFRLTDKEAGDITAYLMGLKNKVFEEMKFEALDPVLRDQILIDYFSQFSPVADAKKKLAEMTDDQRNHELGYRSISKYGCYSCHTVDGFEPDRAPIGPELTNVGSKPVEQFGFGIQKDVPHTRHNWIAAHLKEPARWDIGIPKEFGDINKMPNFYLSDKEIESITTALLGQVSDKVPMKGRKNLNANEALAEKGKKITNKYNCEGCHKIDGRGGDLVKALDDPSEGAPYLVKQGHRVQTDWFYNFLKNVHPIRPWVKVRMPSFNFTNDEINTIVTYFQAEAGQVTFEDAHQKITWEPGEKEAAKKLFNELACTSCHTGGFSKEEAQAPNLFYVKKRLRMSWVEKWLENPQAILEYTAMPNFWDGGKASAVPGVLNDDPKKQMKALTKYIFEMGYDRDPEAFRKE